MRLRGKTWLFFVGYDHEYDEYKVRLSWGGMGTERGINGLFPWKRTFVVGFRFPMLGWRPIPFVRFRRT